MELKVSSPCPMSWDDLAGNDRIRYCGKCKLNVYNLAEMSAHEVEAIVRRTEGRLCGRLYLRGDRTASLRDCPSAEKSRILKRIVATASVLFLAIFASVFRSMEGPDRSRFPGWLQVVAEMIDPEPAHPPPSMLGGICAPPKAPVFPPAPTAPASRTSGS
jgi:hypothetical protein